MKYPVYKTKAIVFTAKEKAEVRDNIKCPEVDDETVVIKTSISGLSRGTETDVYTGNLHDPGENFFPLIPGYEPVGKAVFVGEKITHIKVGDLCLGFNLHPTAYDKTPYCSVWGGQVEYAVYSKKSAPVEWYGLAEAAGRRVAKIPTNLDEIDGIFGVLGGVAYHGVERIGIKKDETVAIIGLGVVGNSASQFCQNLGARVIAFDLHSLRCEIARKCGIRHSVNATKNDIREVISRYTGGKGVDVVIECSGEVSNIDICLDIVSSNGRVHLQGAYLEPYKVLIQQSAIFFKNVAISGSCGASVKHITNTLVQIEKKQLIVRPMLTKIFPVKDAQKAYQLNLYHPDKSLKLGFKW